MSERIPGGDAGEAPSGSGRLPRNVRLFQAFRVLYNARFYYPVLAIFFVDLGLTLEQYALLNVAWALSIVLAELPLGAIGDTTGRRPMVVMAASLMVVEMAVLAFFPTANATLLFYALLANRVLSGISEAAASGADEALAYDSLVDEGQEARWPDALATLQRTMSVAMMLAMIVGGAVYDPAFVGKVLAAVGIETQITIATTVRFPVYLTFAMSLGAFVTSLAMTEPRSGRAEREDGSAASVADNWRQVKSAGAWIGRTPPVLVLILFAVALDSVIRLFLTLTSSYYRLIGIAPVYYGLLATVTGVLGIFMPSVSKRLVRRLPAAVNFTFLAALTLVGLAGLAWRSDLWGLLFLAILSAAFNVCMFFVSHYLNRQTASNRRATVLSFRSLANNVAYGAIGVGFSVLMRGLAGGEAPPPGSAEENRTFAEALVWLAPSYLVAAVPILGFAWSVGSLRTVEEEPGPAAEDPQAAASTAPTAGPAEPSEDEPGAGDAGRGSRSR